jgi:hypothetical protein
MMEDKIDGECSRNERDNKIHTKFCSEYLKQGYQLGEISIDGRIGLKWILKCMDLIHVSQYRAQWRVLVNTVMNLLVID